MNGGRGGAGVVVDVGRSVLGYSGYIGVVIREQIWEAGAWDTNVRFTCLTFGTETVKGLYE